MTADSYVNTWNYGALGSNAQSTSAQYAQIAGFDDLQCGTTEDEEGNDVADCEGAPPSAETMSGLVVDSDTQFTITMSEPVPFLTTQMKGLRLPAAGPRSSSTTPTPMTAPPVGNGPLMMNGEWGG